MTFVQLHDSVTRFAGLMGSDADDRGVLAAPDAIAVVTRHERGVTTTHVVATRGPWLAEVVIEGAVRRVHTGDADHAALLLVDRCGFLEGDVDVSLVLGRAVDVSVGAYLRAAELAAAADPRRARAALVAEAVPALDAHELVGALTRCRIEVAGLAADGRRFIGCDLAVAGDAQTGRWLVPPSAHAGAALGDTSPLPALGSQLRCRIERVGAADLRDELALVFGAV